MEEYLVNSPFIQEALGLSQSPDYTTMCKALKRLRVVVLTLLLYLTGRLFTPTGKTGIDSTGFDRRHASKHYVKRAKMTLQSMKVTFIVDTENLLILDLHATVTRKHDSQILLQLTEKVMKQYEIDVLTADKGYDSKEIRDTLRDLGIRPLIKHREFTNLDKAHNARMITEDYLQRLMTETVNSMTKRRYTDTLTTQNYWNQTRELLFIAITHNIDRHINTQITLIHIRISTELKKQSMNAFYSAFWFNEFDKTKYRKKQCKNKYFPLNG